MLSNAYFLAKIRFDTAENEPAKNLQKFANFADPNPSTRRSADRREPGAPGPAPSGRRRPRRRGARPAASAGRSGQHRHGDDLADYRWAQISYFLQKLVKFCRARSQILKFRRANFRRARQIFDGLVLGLIQPRSSPLLKSELPGGGPEAPRAPRVSERRALRPRRPGGRRPRRRGPARRVRPAQIWNPRFAESWLI